MSVLGTHHPIRILDTIQRYPRCCWHETSKGVRTNQEQERRKTALAGTKANLPKAQEKMKRIVGSEEEDRGIQDRRCGRLKYIEIAQLLPTYSSNDQGTLGWIFAFCTRAIVACSWLGFPTMLEDRSHLPCYHSQTLYSLGGSVDLGGGEAAASRSRGRYARV